MLCKDLHMNIARAVREPGHHGSGGGQQSAVIQSAPLQHHDQIRSDQIKAGDN